MEFFKNLSFALVDEANIYPWVRYHTATLIQSDLQRQNPNTEQLMFRARTDTFRDLNSHIYTIGNVLNVTSRCIDFPPPVWWMANNVCVVLIWVQNPQAVSDEVRPKTTESVFPMEMSAKTHTYSHRIYLQDNRNCVELSLCIPVCASWLHAKSVYLPSNLITIIKTCRFSLADRKILCCSVSNDQGSQIKYIWSTVWESAISVFISFHRNTFYHQKFLKKCLCYH